MNNEKELEKKLPKPCPLKSGELTFRTFKPIEPRIAYENDESIVILKTDGLYYWHDKGNK